MRLAGPARARPRSFAALMHAAPHPDPAAPALVPREGLLLLLLAAVNFTHILDFVIMMPLGPQLMRVFEISPRQFGFLVSAYTFAAAVSGFISTFFIDRLDRKTALLWLYAGFTVGTLCCAVAPTYGLLLAARIVSGFFGGVLGALVLAIVGDCVPEARRGAATGKIMAAFAVASVAGVPLGLYLASTLSWHAPFFMLAGISAFVLVMCRLYLPRLRGHLSRVGPHAPLDTLLSMVRNPNLQWALGLMVLLTLAGFTVVPFISPYMVANVGFKEIELSYIYLIGGLASMVTSQVAGRLADRYGKARVFTWAALFSLIPILALTHLPPVHKAIAFTVTTLFFIGFGARFVPAMAMITSSVEPRQRGAFMSFNSSVQQLGSGSAAFLAGLIVEREQGRLLHFDTVGYLACLATIACVLAARKLKVAG